MHTKSNHSFGRPHNPDFKPPQTKAEFQKLSYTERAQLQENYPGIYEMFTKPRQW